MVFSRDFHRFFWFSTKNSRFQFQGLYPYRIILRTLNEQWTNSERTVNEHSRTMFTNTLYPTLLEQFMFHEQFVHLLFVGRLFMNNFKSLSFVFVRSNEHCQKHGYFVFVFVFVRFLFVQEMFRAVVQFRAVGRKVVLLNFWKLSYYHSHN